MDKMDKINCLLWGRQTSRRNVVSN